MNTRSCSLQSGRFSPAPGLQIDHFSRFQTY